MHWIDAIRRCDRRCNQTLLSVAAMRESDAEMLESGAANRRCRSLAMPSLMLHCWNPMRNLMRNPMLRLLQSDCCHPIR
jgi:hypothetical protein